MIHNQFTPIRFAAVVETQTIEDAQSLERSYKSNASDHLYKLENDLYGMYSLGYDTRNAIISLAKEIPDFSQTFSGKVTTPLGFSRNVFATGTHALILRAARDAKIGYPDQADHGIDILA